MNSPLFPSPERIDPGQDESLQEIHELMNIQISSPVLPAYSSTNSFPNTSLSDAVPRFHPTPFPFVNRPSVASPDSHKLVPKEEVPPWSSSSPVLNTNPTHTSRQGLSIDSDRSFTHGGFSLPTATFSPHLHYPIPSLTRPLSSGATFSSHSPYSTELFQVSPTSGRVSVRNQDIVNVSFTPIELSKYSTSLKTQYFDQSNEIMFRRAGEADSTRPSSKASSGSNIEDLPMKFETEYLSESQKGKRKLTDDERKIKSKHFRQFFKDGFAE